MTTSFPLALIAGKPTAVPATTTLVLRPGGTADQNVFTDWPTLNAAAAPLVGQGPYTIVCDCAGAPGDGNCHVTAGAWTIGPDVTLQGDPSQALNGFGLVFDDGATLDAAPAFLDDLNTTSASTTAIVTVPVGGATPAVLYLIGAASFSAPNADAFVYADPSAAIIVFLNDAATLHGSGFACVTANQVFVQVVDVCTLEANAVRSVAGTILFVVSSASFSNTQLGGPVSLDMAIDAANITYSPANVGDWSGTAPTSVANALDRIAAKITPIP